MLMLVMCRPAGGGDQAEFRRLAPRETTALRELKASGVLAGAWSPGRGSRPESGVKGPARFRLRSDVRRWR
jgi:hypothetical protein